MRKRKIFIISRRELKRRRRSIIRDFALTTSAHGIPGIARSRTRPNCIFWTISFITFASITLYFVSREIRSYFEYQTQTSVEMRSEFPQNFPAFTVCNLAPVRYDRFSKQFADYSARYNISEINDPSLFTPENIRHLLDFFQMRLNRNESIDEFFFPLSDMLIRCIFNGKNCSHKSFTSFAIPNYGRCYTFNGKLKNKEQMHHSNENGREGSLYLRFYVHSHQYIPYIREGVGMIGIVHDNRQLPQIDRAGMALAAGFKHRITFTKKTIYYLPPPYSDCSDKIPTMMGSMFDNYQPNDYSYSAELCHELCPQVYIYEQCGCIDPMKWHARTIVIPSTGEVIFAPLCNISDPCYSQSVASFANSQSLLKDYCQQCSPQCSLTTFSVHPSSWKAPPVWLLNETKKFVEKSGIPLPNDWSTNWRSHVESNYLSIELIHQSSIVENYTQTETMTAVDALSNVGGQTGLWIGVSFLSLVEVAEMLFRLVRHQLIILRRTFSRIC